MFIVNPNIKSLNFVNEIIQKHVSEETLHNIFHFCYDWLDLCSDIEKPDIGIPLISRALSPPLFTITELDSNVHKHKAQEERYVWEILVKTGKFY